MREAFLCANNKPNAPIRMHARPIRPCNSCQHIVVTLVHRSSIVAVLKLFALAFFSAASARGQWKSPFPLAIILEPPVKILFPLAVLLRKQPVEIVFSLAVFLFSRQWKFSRLFLNFRTEIYIYLHTQTYIYI